MRRHKKRFLLAPLNFSLAGYPSSPLKKFMDRFDRVRKEAWERPHLTMGFVDEADGNLAFIVDGYHVQVHPQEDAAVD